MHVALSIILLFFRSLCSVSQF